MKFEISVILPAYNEARRLPPYLEAVRAYLESRFKEAYEVLVVDDGSRDATQQIVIEMVRHWPQLRLLQHAGNEGKGAAVRTGVLAARGDLLLFADADGAAPIEESSRLVAAIAAGADIAIGSRLLHDRDVVRRRHWRRGLAGQLFAGTARRLLGLDVLDTQCGFKMFRRDAACRLFAAAREKRYLFDLELLMLARDFHMKVVEVPICWHEVSGGHMRPFRELPQIIAGLWRLKRR